MQPFGNNQNQGLFTFYRQQADYEQTLKFQKKFMKNTKPKNSQKRSNNYNRKDDVTEYTKDEQIKLDQQHKNQNSKLPVNHQKMLEILEKHKYKKGKKKPIKVIMMSKDSRLEEDETYKKKKYVKIKQNPFQKLALQPINFSGQLEQFHQEKSHDLQQMLKLKLQSSTKLRKLQKSFQKTKQLNDKTLNESLQNYGVQIKQNKKRYKHILRRNLIKSGLQDQSYKVFPSIIDGRKSEMRIEQIKPSAYTVKTSLERAKSKSRLNQLENPSFDNNQFYIKNSHKTNSYHRFEKPRYVIPEKDKKIMDLQKNVKQQKQKNLGEILKSLNFT